MKARTCLLYALIVMLSLSAIPAAVADESYQIPLIKEWKVKRLAELGDIGGSFFRMDSDDSAWEAANIPDAEPVYEERFILYRKWVEVPASWKGKKVSAIFGGAHVEAVFYINGQELGRHSGMDVGFSFDVADMAKYGERNLLAVLCDNSGGGKGGLYGPISIALTVELANAKALDESNLKSELGKYSARIVYETYRKNNWELYMVAGDGSNPVNLTKTPESNELYPHVSPDGTKVCFVSDEGEGDSKVRNVYYMNLDGTGRTKVADNARQPCWSPNSNIIAYLKGEFDKFSYLDYASKGIFFYDLATNTHTQHPNSELSHLYNLCWSPDGNWFVATVHGGMGYNHAILAIEAKGTKVFDLKISGCRPDISPDGERIAWGRSDWHLSVGDLDLSLPQPKVTNRRDMVVSMTPIKVYHVDWSPDGRFVAFSRGPIAQKSLGYAQEIVGIQAQDWDICVADVSKVNNWICITADGLSNKEPDWAKGK